MNRMSVRVGAVLSVLCAVTLNATTSQFRSPLSLERGPIHVYLDNAHDSWWASGACMQQMDCEPLPCGIMLEPWVGAYDRRACKSFVNCNPCSNGMTRNTSSLSALFFGATSFTGAQAFPGSTVPIGNNPALIFSTITPSFTYDEKGVYFGLQGWYELDDCECPGWHVGGRVSIPFKYIQINNSTTSLSATQLEQVAAEVALNLNTPVGSAQNLYDFAFRLDFLSTLFRPALPPFSGTPMVQYNIPNATMTTMIAGTPVANLDGSVSSNIPPILLIKRPDGSLPPRVPVPTAPSPVAWAKDASQATGGVLPVDGSGVANGVYYFGGSNLDYFDNLGKNIAAQATLFVVPRLISADPTATPPVIGDSTFNSPTTQGIQNAIDAVIKGFSQNETGIELLATFSIDLTQQECIVGNGDLRFDFLFGFENDGECWWDYWYVDGVIGFLVPTGKRDKNALNVFYQTLGNNGHWEIKLGIEGALRPVEWFALELDASFNHAFRRTEFRAAPFTGATIRNIGPQVEVGNSWSYGIVRIDANFFHPCNPDLGVTLGYEFWGKTRDHISLDQATAVTLLGVTAPLDGTILENQTNSSTNKVRGELFYRCNYFEIFAGASQVVSGKWAMKESEIHLGFMLYF